MDVEYTKDGKRYIAKSKLVDGVEMVTVLNGAIICGGSPDAGIIGFNFEAEIEEQE